MIYQRSLSRSVSVAGVGIHSGKRVSLSIYPAQANSGITFRRTDLPGACPLEAKVASVGATKNNTTIGEGENVIHTVEHLLSVLYGLGIDNAFIEVDGPEVPIMDGSGASFIFLLEEAGVCELHALKNFLIVLKPVEVSQGDAWACVGPSNRLIIDSTIDFPHVKIRRQQRVFEFSCEAFVTEIARARTFGPLKDVNNLRKKGLAKGGSLDNAIVLDDFGVLNKDGLRFEDEFVRHKILDTVGDLALLGHELAAKVTTYKSGHHLHNLLCRKLLATKDAYRVVSARDLAPETYSFFELPPVLARAF